MFSYRPYPTPNMHYIMHQMWLDLLLMYWCVPVEDLRPLIPASLQIDIFEGNAWIAVVPFHMSGVYVRTICPVCPNFWLFQS
ncbi:MAG: DUF2071 domain-containing protein [Chloroflexi bacterium]|nr:DUF2071 domain-containing protein [Chloroflexota bacterium]